MRIDCVFFDYDGVLTLDATGSATTCRYLSECHGIPFERLRNAFARHNRALTLGHVTHEAVWPEICADIGRALPIGVLTDAFDSTPVNGAMFDLARRVRSACRVAIITDNKVDRMCRVTAMQRLDQLFDPIVVSAAERVSKSSKALFERAWTAAGVQAANSVFIDNDMENIAVAAACGMQAIHFDHVRNDVDALAKRLQDEFSLPA